ncbi:hypothetical protein Tco_0567695 [Tanacetum coccineum]
MATNEINKCCWHPTRPLNVLVENDYESGKIRKPQVFPTHLHTYSIRQAPAKDLDNVEMLMAKNNDMKITQLEIPTHQMNTKFVNKLPAYWGKYVTNVKQNMDISTTPYVQIYTHLKAYEPHAKKTLKKQEAIANLVCGFQSSFSTNQQPAQDSSSNSRTHATVHYGPFVTEPIQKESTSNCKEQKIKDGLRGKSADVNAPHPYDQSSATDYNKHVSNQSRVQPTSPVMRVTLPMDNQIFDNDGLNAFESGDHQVKHLDSRPETKIDDNTIPISVTS